MVIANWILENWEVFIFAYMGYRLDKLTKETDKHNRQITLIGHHVHRMESK